MSITWQYGSYQHDEGECQVQINRVNTHTDSGVRTKVVDRYTVTGRIHGTSADDLSSKIRAMQNAYSYDNKSFGLSGTAHTVNARDAIIKVVEGPSFPEGAGGQYTTYRDFTIVIEASQTARNALGSSRTYSETITVSGGGPRYVFIEVLNGPPQKQMPVRQTVCVITQEGQATSPSSHPSAASPLFPGLLMESPTIRKNRPQLINGIPSEPYTTSWSYRFGSPTRVNI
jgi:hypothetical protein